MSNVFDVGYLSINQLAYQFIKLSQSNVSKTNSGILIDTATKCLQLMRKYEVIHPVADHLVHYLSKVGRSSIEFTNQWIDETRTLNESYLLQLDHDSMDTLSQEKSQELFNKIRKAVIIAIVQNKYDDGLVLLNNYITAVDFSTQPKTKEQFISNRYMEFLFYQYVLNIFSLIWFPNDEADSNRIAIKPLSAGKFSKATVTNNSYKPLNQILSKVKNYHTKNESLFGVTDDETRYYWGILFFNLCLLFKQFKFVEFYDSFTEYFIEQQEPLNYLVHDFDALKSNLLAMFGIVSIFLKPFNSLRLIDIDTENNLIDLCSEDPASLEYKFYGQVMVPLAKCDFKNVRSVLHNEDFVADIISQLEYNLPVSCRTNDGNTGPSFINYMMSIIDSKNFFVILTNSKEISRLKVAELLGYDITDQNSVAQLSNSLIGIISALDLQRYGVSYDSKTQNFTNEEIRDASGEIAELQENINDLQAEVRAETLATRMTELLLEKYYN
ncbi:hypothetical protein SBY92_000199 [Candida maltosa Xu316]